MAATTSENTFGALRDQERSSKFAQLMSEEKITSFQKDQVNELLEGEDNIEAFEKSNINGNWSFQWTRHQSPLNLDTSDDIPSIFTSFIPDDDIARKDIDLPLLHNQRQIHFIPSLLTTQQVQSILDIVTFQTQQQKQGSSPKTKCIVAIEDGERKLNTQHPNHCIATVLEPILQQQILPLVRSIYQAPNMVLADSLIRWYISDELQGGAGENLPPHYDLTAYASMIIPLNPEDCKGGLYIQAGAAQNSRLVVNFQRNHVDRIRSEETLSGSNGMKRGDAILHKYDVMHGVQLNGGTRYSLVLWMALDEDSLKNNTAPWVKEDAVSSKSVHAAFLYGMFAQNGLLGVPKDLSVAKKYWEWASVRGHALSQYMLSMLLIKIGFEDSSTNNSQSKVEWSNRIVSLLQSSADRGLDVSQHALAQIYRWGYHGISRDEKVARKYYIAAAKQGHKKSIEALLGKV